MERKTVLLLATIGLVICIGSAVGISMYYSGIETTTSKEWGVSINGIPPETVRYENVSLSGVVKLGNILQSGINVTIYLALNSTDPGDFSSVGTDITDTFGAWEFAYNNTEPAGTVLNFKAGVSQ